MKKISYKVIATILLLVSIIMVFIFKNEPICQYIQTIGISLAINLISSIIIIYLIDIKKENDANKELYRKREMIYKKLVAPIMHYYGLINSMYKATVSKENVDLSILKHNLDDDSVLFDKFKLLDNEKEGYVFDPISKRNLKWKHIIINNVLEYISNIEEFYNINSYLIDNELSEYLNKIISHKSIRNLGNNALRFNIVFETNDLLETFGVKEIYEMTNKIRQCISKYVGENSFSFSESGFLRNDIAPSFKSGIKSN